MKYLYAFIKAIVNRQEAIKNAHYLHILMNHYDLLHCIQYHHGILTHYLTSLSSDM